MLRAFTLLSVVALVANLSAAELAPGEKAPEFAGLPGTDGKMHSLADLKAAKVVVVCFTCNGCPVAKEYESRFVEFAKQYKAKGVEFVALNTKASEDVDAMKARAEEAGFCFTYADDTGAATAKSFGAKVTPHLFVLDQNRTLAYSGAFDDNADASKTKKSYVAAAVDALLAGQKPEVSSTKPVGCGISYK
jgi:peroxiredoxin